MNWVFWLSVIVLATAAYVSALVTALMLLSRAALEQHLDRNGHLARAQWLFDHDVAVRHATALLRTALRLAFFALVLLEVVGAGDDATLTYGDLLIAGLIALVLLWVFTTLLASALAHHVSVSLIAGALPMLRTLATLCFPLTRGLGFIDEVVKRLAGANLRQQQQEAEAELLRSIEETHREGALDEKAATLLENVVEFTSTDVGEVMTPRTDIDGIELTDNLSEIRDFILKVGHSRIPIYVENLDHIAGILYVKDLVPFLGTDGSGFNLRSILRQPIVVPEIKPVRELLADFQRAEVHMAMVIDEYGGTAGLVTIEDVLEEIVGEIHDEHEPGDEIEPTLLRLDETRAEVDGRFHIDDLNQELGLNLPEDEEFDTVAGFVLATLGRVPQPGESFHSHNARFTTLLATPTHIRKLEIELAHTPPPEGEKRQRDDGA